MCHQANSIPTEHPMLTTRQSQARASHNSPQSQQIARFLIPIAKVRQANSPSLNRDYHMTATARAAVGAESRV